jgi:dipeptidyl aminopeptidase/acylaminoacyl peptidase
VTDGTRDQELRCSPDGSMLAVVRDIGNGRRIDRIDLRRMVQSPWAELPIVYWMELCAEGMVVSHWARSGVDALTLVPWQGQLQTLAETAGSVMRFSAASAGSRVVYAHGRDVWSIDSPGAATKLPVYGYGVTNMEMSPDGRSVAVVTNKGLELDTGAAEPKLLDGNPNVHTVWFSRDGAELAWASPEGAVWKRGETVRTLEPRDEDEPIKAMRFLRGGPGLLVSRGNEVIRWSPEHEETEVLARVEDGRELLGADVFDGGLVLWLGTPLTYLRHGEPFAPKAKG